MFEAERVRCYPDRAAADLQSGIRRIITNIPADFAGQGQLLTRRSNDRKR
jgi:hypothetical protein